MEEVTSKCMCIPQSDLKGVSSLGIQRKQTHKAGRPGRSEDAYAEREGLGGGQAEGELGSDCGTKRAALKGMGLGAGFGGPSDGVKDERQASAVPVRMNRKLDVRGSLGEERTACGFARGCGRKRGRVARPAALAELSAPRLRGGARRAPGLRAALPVFPVLRPPALLLLWSRPANPFSRSESFLPALQIGSSVSPL